MHGSSILRNHGEYHLELIIRTSANIPSLHSRDEALALISILLLWTQRPRYTTTIGGRDRWAGQSNGNGAVPRTGSLDRKRHESTGASLIARRGRGQIKMYSYAVYMVGSRLHREYTESRDFVIRCEASRR